MLTCRSETCGAALAFVVAVVLSRRVLTMMSSYPWDPFDSLASRSQHQQPIVIAQRHPTSPTENSARLAGCCCLAYKRSLFARRLFFRLVPQPRALRCCHMCALCFEGLRKPRRTEAAQFWNAGTVLHLWSAHRQLPWSKSDRLTQTRGDPMWRDDLPDVPSSKRSWQIVYQGAHLHVSSAAAYTDSIHT